MTEIDEAAELAEEIPDEAVQDSSFYEVWVYGYDKEDDYTGYSKLIEPFRTREAAEEFAATYEVPEAEMPPYPAVYVRIEVELKDDPGDSILYTVSSKVQVIR